MNTPKRTHYIPRNYLKAWSSNGKRIYQLDKTAENPVPKLIGLRDAGVERFFYSPELESVFGKQVEEPAWPMLTKIREHRPVPYREMGGLLSYMVAQYARTPKMRQFLLELSEDIVRDLMNKYRGLGIDLDREGFDDDRLRKMCEELFPIAQLGVDTSRYYGTDLSSLGTVTQSDIGSLQFEGMRRIISHMEWSIQKLGPFGEFIVSDAPVSGWCERDNDVMGAISFPLSPDLLLSGRMCNVGPGRGSMASSLVQNRAVEYRRVDERIAHDFNRSLADEADRFIFGKSEKALLASVRPSS